MPRPLVVATHSHAGRVEWNRLAVRLREASRDAHLGIDSSPRPIVGGTDWPVLEADGLGEGTYLAGAANEALGPIELTTHLESAGLPGRARVVATVRNRSAREMEIASVIVP